MSNDEIVKIANRAGFSAYNRDGEFSIAVIEGCGAVVCTEEVVKLINLIEQRTLEMAAQHFDERGKYPDGTWCDGWYNPNEPGEILRSMKISD
ncbi:MAG: hypothetical protein ACRCVU_20275 [Flavobacterium sp.]